MPVSPLGFRATSEVKEELEAERAGRPFLLYRDDDGRQRLVVLDGHTDRLSIGRRFTCDVPLAWDGEVSRLHAQLERTGEDYVLVDDGLSRNGSFVNGDRVIGRRRLCDGDTLRFGDTLAVFRAPADGESELTIGPGASPRPEISEAQRRVLVALCRPIADPRGLGMPATNQDIADELFLSVDAVKTHLRALFHKFGVEDLPQNQKRARLVQLALTAGELSELDLHPG
jgi:pSer/pThr/pTyr-binding forkhead associated (FHA) protein